MGTLNIFIDDSVGEQLGYDRPVVALEDFIAPANLGAATKFVRAGNASSLDVDCIDANLNQVSAKISVWCSGAARFVRLQIDAINPSHNPHFPTSGALSDGTILWAIDTRTMQIRVTHRAGVSEELVSFTAELGPYIESIHEADRQAFESQVQACIQAGEDMHLSFRVVRPTGEVRLLEAFARAVRQDDTTIEVVGMTIDVTSRMQASHALAQESARLEHALAASKMGIWEWDVQADHVTWSEKIAEIFGISLDEFAGTLDAFSEFVHPDDAVHVQSTISDFLSGISPEYVIDHRIIRPGGEVRWIEGRGNLTRDEAGAPAVFIGTLWDATTQRLERDRVRQIEHELVRASGRLKLATEAAGIGLWEVNLNTFVASWDAQMCRLWGMELDCYLGPRTAWGDAFHPDDFAAVDDIMGAVEDGQATSSFRVVLPDGTIRHILSFAQVVSESGMAPRLVGLCIDVSERKEAEVRERNRNRVLEALVSTASVEEVLGVLVTVLEEEEDHSRFGFMLVDASGKFLDNAAAPSMPGFYLDAIDHLPIGAGQGSCGTAAFLREPVIAEDVQVHPNWGQYRDLAASAGIRASWSIPILGPNGRLFGTLGMYSGTARLRDDDLLRRMTAAADFAALAIERKRAEVSAKNREQLLQSMGEIAGMGGWEFDLLSQVRTWTNEMNKIHGLDPDSSEQDVLGLYTPESQVRIQAAMAHTAQTGEPWTMELELDTAAGQHVWIRSDGRAQYVDGRIVRLFGAAHNITAQKLAERDYLRLQEQLLHSQKLESIGRLAGGVAHDFNNIVSVILGHAELAMETVSEGSELMEDLNEIRLAAERSAALTQQLLAFARKQPMTPVVVNINDTIAVMVNMLRRLIGGQIALSWKSEPDLWSVYVDPAQIDQILANLCVNARDAIDTRGTVNISTTNVVLDEEAAAGLDDCPPGPYVCLSIADDGCGISTNILENIFEPFFTTKGIGMGTGLGLATVYGIVKQNGGGIRVESQVGVGTRFEVYFPKEGGTDTTIRDEVVEHIPTRLFSTVLLVDDEPSLLKVATRMLKGLGHQVYAALGPDEAMRLAAEIGTIDVLLTDVIMPDMNGKELSEALAPLHPEMRIVLMSGYTAEVLEEEGVQRGTLFLQKPFSLSELGEVIMAALNPV